MDKDSHFVTINSISLNELFGGEKALLKYYKNGIMK